MKNTDRIAGNFAMICGLSIEELHMVCTRYNAMADRMIHATSGDDVRELITETLDGMTTEMAFIVGIYVRGNYNEF